MADGQTGTASDTPFALTDRERIPTQRYYDPGFYALEAERLWPRVWQMACRLEQIHEICDWIEYSNLVFQRVTEDGRARGEPTPDLAELAVTDPLRGVEYIFPHYLTRASPEKRRDAMGALGGSFDRPIVDLGKKAVLF